MPLLLLVALVVTFFGYHTPSFRLDASADSLVLEHDEALHYYRSIRARYGSDYYLIATYTPVALSIRLLEISRCRGEIL